jgi:hypothetical protein
MNKLQYTLKEWRDTIHYNASVSISCFAVQHIYHKPGEGWKNEGNSLSNKAGRKLHTLLLIRYKALHNVCEGEVTSTRNVTVLQAHSEHMFVKIRHVLQSGTCV